jgi:hypothetical protein
MSRQDAMIYTGCKTLATFYHRIKQGNLARPDSRHPHLGS